MKRFKYESGTLLSKDETISENLCMLLLTGEIMLYAVLQGEGKPL